MERIERWKDAVVDLYNACLTAPCTSGRDSPSLPETAPERPPLPLSYTEFLYLHKRHGFQQRPQSPQDQHCVEWNREHNVQRVCRRKQTDQNSHPYWNTVTVSQALMPDTGQLHGNIAPSMHLTRARAVDDGVYHGWPCERQRGKMHSPISPTHTSSSAVDTADSDSEYFTPRITPRALRQQAASPQLENQSHARSGGRPEGSPLTLAQAAYYHTLPVPRSRVATPKPRLSVFPQGVHITLVDRPLPMRACITPPSSPRASSPHQYHFHPIQCPPTSQSHSQGLADCRPLQRQGLDAPSAPSHPSFVHKPSAVKVSRHPRASATTSKPAQDRTKEESHAERNADPKLGPRGQVNLMARNVFGQPLMSATLKTPQSPQLTRRTKVEEDLRKLLMSHNTVTNNRKVSSIEGVLYSGEPAHSAAVGQTRPRQGNSSPTMKNGYGSLSELSNIPTWDLGTPDEDGMLTPVETPAYPDWRQVIHSSDSKEAMKGEPGEKAVNFSSPETQTNDLQGHTPEELSRQLNYLENILGELTSDLKKERRDKQALMAEVESLRKNNHHLLEESLFAYEELHKLKTMFSIAPGQRK